jgi:predicted permease
MPLRDRYHALRALLHGDRPDRDVAEEFEHHLTMRIEENIASGMSPDAARAEALQRFGDIEAFRAETRRIDESELRTRRRTEWLDAITGELRRAARSLARTPGFSVTAFVTLALGLGATITIFALLDAVVLHPLRYDDPSRLVVIKHPVPGIKPGDEWNVSSAGYFHFKRESKTLSNVGAWEGWEPRVTFDGTTERARGAQVSASLFETLRFRPLLGRFFPEEDERRGRQRTVILSHSYWKRRFGADSSVIGRTMVVDDAPVPIAAVLRKGDEMPDYQPDLYTASRLDPAETPYNWHRLRVIARLAPGATPASARAELEQFIGTFTTLYPTAYTPNFMTRAKFGVSVTPLRDDVLHGIGKVLWTLFASVALVLIIAGANVANLFLVRAETRQREAAVRIALGAGRARLAWQFFAESLVISLAAGAAGVGMAAVALRLVVARAPEGLPRIADITLLPSTIAFAAALVVLAAGVFAALQVARTSGTLATLRDGGRGLTVSRRQHAVRGALIVGQLAFALVLLAAAGVMVRSFRHLRAVNPGFAPAGVLAFNVTIPSARYFKLQSPANPGAAWGGVESSHRRLAERFAAIPGVTDVGLSTTIPLDDPGGCSGVATEDPNADGSPKSACIGTALAGPGFFRTLSIPLKGTEPAWADVEAKAGGVVVTKALADRFWPGENPIGKGIKPNNPSKPLYRVVAVTAVELRDDGLDRPPMQAVFFPLMPMDSSSLWSPPFSIRFVLRAPGADRGAIVASARRIVTELEPGAILGEPRTMDEVVAKSTARVTFVMLLLVVAASMAIVLSAVGIYGVIAYVVGQRRAEIGIRMALGASTAGVVGMVARESIRLALLGVGLGLVGALLTTRLFASLLYEVKPSDPLTLASGAMFLLAVSALAGWLPARKAARVSPLDAMR